MISRFTAILVAVLAVTGPPCASVSIASPEKGDDTTELSNASLGQLKSILGSGDLKRIRAVAQALRWREPRYKDPIYPFLRDLWEGKSPAVDPVAPHVLRDKATRMYIAGSLLAAWRVKWIVLEPKKIVDFARNNLDSTDAEVRDAAIVALDFVESEAIVQAIYRIAAREDPATFGKAAFVLIGKCSAQAAEALARLMASVRKEEHRTFLREAKAHWESVNRNPRLCPRVCVDCGA